MANAEQLAILKEGVQVWNSWRELNRNVPLDLESADLSGIDLERIDLADANLEGADLSGARLNHANLVHARLRRANLTNAILDYANLAHAQLDGANLAFASLQDAMLPFAHLDGANLSAANLKNTRAEDAHFKNANLSYASLQDAVLSCSDFRRANLLGANLEGANMIAINLESANLSLVKFDRKIFLKTLRQVGFNPTALWRRRLDLVLDTTIRCKGIHAIASYGSQRFKLFLQDQDYLEELMETSCGRFWCFLWWLSANCGRSLIRWASWSLGIAFFYAIIYWHIGSDNFHFEHMPFSFATVLYYSIVTFTTLGFGDIVPLNNLAAYLVATEVLFGYVMLGGLISIFAGKLSRRSG
jgi:uncharacterized protein YjbI with pentapeptide repeats